MHVGNSGVNQPTEVRNDLKTQRVGLIDTYKVDTEREYANEIYTILQKSPYYNNSTSHGVTVEVTCEYAANSFGICLLQEACWMRDR